ncbi:hypothetical protein AURDEDRAFT_159360 [Auricularia subglabra TFB-10046 SS5]|nr:hypothetical protein AURDEDRAFT_159360 [Auricularia subglabra TFB-10046 SS5]
MDDPLHNKAKYLYVDAHDYARLLQAAASGQALWQPTRVDVGGDIGDCGQISNGKFFKSFNIFKNDSGSPSLRFLYDERSVKAAGHVQETPYPNVDIVKSQHMINFSMGFDVSAETIPDVLDISVDANVAWENSELAFLQYCGARRIVKDSSPVLRHHIQQYLTHHDAELRAHLRTPPGCRLVVLTRVVLSPSFLGGLARQTSSTIAAKSKLNVFNRIGGAFRLSATETWSQPINTQLPALSPAQAPLQDASQAQSPPDNPESSQSPQSPSQLPSGGDPSRAQFPLKDLARYSRPPVAEAVPVPGAGAAAASGSTSARAPEAPGDPTLYCVVVEAAAAKKWDVFRSKFRIRRREKTTQQDTKRPPAGVSSPQTANNASTGPSADPSAGPSTVNGTAPVDEDAVFTATTSDSLSVLMKRALEANPAVDVVIASWDILTSSQVLLHHASYHNSFCPPSQTYDDLGVRTDVEPVLNIGPNSTRPQFIDACFDGSGNFACQTSLPSHD